ncbi:MYND finger containing protein [Novymonas esmeraldas]|uniref:MYND finger containing protein n=1 Tax=Novymonas esmeraldas TaxID=1808958 RepID=A0AAW0ERD9_9TRYP
MFEGTSSMGDRRGRSGVAALRLDALEVLAQEQCLLNARMDARLRELEERVAAPQPVVTLEAPYKIPLRSSSSASSAGNSVDAAWRRSASDAAAPSMLACPTGESAAPMCDYCFRFSDNCFPCPRCQREWYCSAACQRLRHRHHTLRCEQQCSPRDAQPMRGLTH